MFVIFTTILFSLTLVEAKNISPLSIGYYATKIYNSGNIGIEVQDPSTTESRSITLKNGFFQFFFMMANANKKSVVITDFKVELIKSGVVVSEQIFIPQAFVPNTPSNGGVGDINRRFFAHLDPDIENGKPVGGFRYGKFFIDGLESDEIGLYKYDAKFTFNGFITGALIGDDPFADNQGVFKQIKVFKIDN